MYDGAVMITASHLPSHRNGFKFFSRAGGLNKQDIAEVRGDGGRATPPLKRMTASCYSVTHTSHQDNPSPQYLEKPVHVLAERVFTLLKLQHLNVLSARPKQQWCWSLHSLDANKK